MQSDENSTPAPMEVARALVDATRLKRSLERDVAKQKKRVEELSTQVLDLIEAEQLPHSFKIDGASLYTKEEMWASPVDGNHERLAAVLAELGLVEYLPSKVNSQSISAFVREHRDDTGEVIVGGEDGLDPRLAAALNITRTPKAVVNG